MNAIEILKRSKSIIAISNYKTLKSIENFSLGYDCIVRFNAGANPEEIAKRNTSYNLRTDVAAINGWLGGFFGNFIGFKGIPILFSRPKLESYENQTIKPHDSFFVPDEFLEKLYHDNFSFIPYNVYCDFVHEFNYKNPSSGLLTLFYIKRYLNKNLEGVNFFGENQMFNTFLDSPTMSHTVDIERDIFDKLEIKNYILDE